MSYCIDTNIFIEAGERYYPPDIVPGFWKNLDGLIDAGRFKAPEMLIRCRWRLGVQIQTITCNCFAPSAICRKDRNIQWNLCNQEDFYYERF